MDLVDVELIPAGGSGKCRQARGCLAAFESKIGPPRAGRPGVSYDFGDRRSELGARSTKSATERSQTGPETYVSAATSNTLTSC